MDCWIVWNVELSDCQIVKLLNCHIVELLDCWIVRLSNYQIVKLSNCRIVELSNCRTVELSFDFKYDIEKILSGAKTKWFIVHWNLLDAITLEPGMCDYMNRMISITNGFYIVSFSQLLGRWSNWEHNIMWSAEHYWQILQWNIPG